jgi:hypothetical protein
MSRETRSAGFSREILELLGEELIAVSRGGPQLQLYLPNLRCRDVDVHWNGEQMTVEVTVENIGYARAGSCDVRADVWLSSANQTYGLQTRCPALDARSSHTLNVGTILNVDTAQFVNVSVIVDPPAQGRPGGEIWESNEEDNTCANGVYTVLGPVPEIPTGLEEPGGE